LIKPIVFKVPKRAKTPDPYSFPSGYAGGMNISVNPDQIAENQSPDMINTNYDGGSVPNKRYGFSRIVDSSLGDTPIQHMAEFGDYFLAVCGGAIYKKNRGG